MKVSNQKPPIWAEANELFKLDELKLGTIFAFGDILYNPFNVILTQDLIIHESRHMDQHRHDENVANLWWKRYLAEPEFRISQEVEAYGDQYAYLCKTTKDRNVKARYLYKFGDMLAGPMYGSIITPAEAREKIRIHSLEIKKGV